MKNEREGHLEKAVEYLLKKQLEGGFWNAHLETNCCMEAQWIMASHFCGIESPKNAAILSYIVNSQREDGSWEVFHDAENGDINTTLECYFAMRISGISPDAPNMRAARDWLLKNQWQKRIRVFTKYWLALFGQWPWDATPSLPPEIVFFPKWFPFNIYRFAAWARATIMPLCVVTSKRPVKELPKELSPDELFPDGRTPDVFKNGEEMKIPPLSLKKFFITADRIFHFYNDKSADSALRRRAVRKAMEWILNHQDDDGFWGGIQPPWIYGIIAMKVEGFSDAQPNMAKAVNALNLHWTEETPIGCRIKASESPVWDTMLAVNSLLEAGKTHECKQLSDAVDYLLEKENRNYGDWAQTVGRDVPPSGWSFQRENKFYPDIDDTAVALLALHKFKKTLPHSDPRFAKITDVTARAVKWIMAMQSKNGGWGAFDRDNNSELVTKIPFCDFGEVLDPPSVDVTSHVVEALVNCGISRNDNAVLRGVNFILSERESDGSWFGRWGINYVYGTWCALTCLKAYGMTRDDKPVADALKWLVSKQNADGGWGEKATTYMSPRAPAPSTASQTAWALIALQSFDGNENAVARGLDFLRKTQNPDGSWNETEFTGTGFPGYGFGAKADLRNGAPLPQGRELSRGFMLRYGYYCQYFPIVALSMAQRK